MSEMGGRGSYSVSNATVKASIYDSKSEYIYSNAMDALEVTHGLQNPAYNTAKGYGSDNENWTNAVNAVKAGTYPYNDDFKKQVTKALKIANAAKKYEAKGQ